MGGVGRRHTESLPPRPPASATRPHAPRSYPSDYRHNTTLKRSQWEDGIAQAAAVAGAAGLPLVVTETSAGLDNRAYDAPFAASFIVHATAALLGIANVPTMSFWTFTDIFEEPGMQSTPWAETFGIQTKYGVPKPSYRALQLLAGFPRVGLPVSAPGADPARPGAPPSTAATATVGNVDVIAGVDAPASGTVTLHGLVTNFNLNLVNAEDPTTGLPVATETGLTLAFTGIPKAAALAPNASVTLLDSTHGWAKPVWLAAGSPTYPSPSLVQAELAASALVATGVPVTLATAPDGSVTASVALPPLEPYAVAHVTLQYATV